MRQKHIGGSEVASLFGEGEDYSSSAYELYLVKSGLMPPPVVDDSPGTRVWYGKRMEPVIASMAAEMFGWEIRSPGPYAIHDRTKGMAASLDGVILEPGKEETRLGYRKEGLLEIKRIEWLQFKRKWVLGEPPPATVLQGQHGLACSNFEWGAVVVLAGEVGLLAYRYRARQNTADILCRKVDEFWDRVRQRKPPEPDGSASSLSALRYVHPEHEGNLDLTEDDDADITAAAFILARENRRASNDVYDLQRNLLLDKMGDAKEAETVNHWISIDGRGGVRVSEKPAL